MTKEELEKEAREYIAEHSEYSEVFGETFVAVDTLTAMVDFAVSREKRIAKLEKENAELEQENELLKADVEFNAKQSTKKSQTVKKYQELVDEYSLEGGGFTRKNKGT